MLRYRLCQCIFVFGDLRRIFYTLMSEIRVCSYLSQFLFRLFFIYTGLPSPFYSHLLPILNSSQFCFGTFSAHSSLLTPLICTSLPCYLASSLLFQYPPLLRSLVVYSPLDIFCIWLFVTFLLFKVLRKPSFVTHNHEREFLSVSVSALILSEEYFLSLTFRLMSISSPWPPHSYLINTGFFLEAHRVPIILQ